MDSVNLVGPISKEGDLPNHKEIIEEGLLKRVLLAFFKVIDYI